MTDPYAPMRKFARLAGPTAPLGRVVIVFLIGEALIIFGPLLLLLFLPSQSAVDAFFDGQTPLTVSAQFAAFAIAAFGITYTVRRAHGRGFWSMVGPSPTQAVTDMWRCARAVFLVLLVQTLLPPWINLADLAEVKPLLIWAAWLPIAVIVIIIQAGTEELLFRGYLQQQFAALSSNKWVWMGLPSFLFGIGHYYNGWGPADGLFYAIWATCLGVACADLTARTGSIGAALGLHLSNNLFALTLVGIKGWPSTGLMLLLYPYDDPAKYDYSLAQFFTAGTLFELALSVLIIATMWLAARIAIRR